MNNLECHSLASREREREREKKFVFKNSAVIEEGRLPSSFVSPPASWNQNQIKTLQKNKARCQYSWQGDTYLQQDTSKLSLATIRWILLQHRAMQGWFGIHKYVSVHHHIDGMELKSLNHSLLEDQLSCSMPFQRWGKVCGIVQYFIVRKTLNQLTIEGIYFHSTQLC